MATERDVLITHRETTVFDLKGTTHGRNMYKAVAAELVGTFALVFVGAGTLTTSSLRDVPKGTAIIDFLKDTNHRMIMGSVFALAYFYLACIFGAISGCHINPAVTLGVLAAGRMSFIYAVYYWVAQFVGAVFGAVCIRLLLQPLVGPLGATELASTVPWINALLLEALFTFLVTLTILMVTESGKQAKWSVGSAFAPAAAIFVAFLVIFPLTGASLNPARSFGPALVAWWWADIWLYFLGPFLGGALAGIVYRAFWSERDDYDVL